MLMCFYRRNGRQWLPCQAGLVNCLLKRSKCFSLIDLQVLTDGFAGDSTTRGEDPGYNCSVRFRSPTSEGRGSYEARHAGYTDVVFYAQGLAF